MGWGEQPYIVFRHSDIEREYIHIVSVQVGRDGKKIRDGKRNERSVTITEQIEKEYGLHPTKGQGRAEAWRLTMRSESRGSLAHYAGPRGRGQAQRSQLEAVDAARGDLKRQIASVVGPVLSMYRFQTLGEFRALLSLYNIGVEDVQGTRAGQAYRGLLYTVLDGDGQKAEVTPIKSSLLGKSCGYDALEKLMKRSGAKIAGDGSREHTRRRVADAVAGASTGNELRERLGAHHIDLYIRRNEDGRITGTTFIDHENRTVLNGSRLGKEYSANALQERFGMGLESDIGSLQQNTDHSEHLQPTPPTVSQTPETRQARPAQRRTGIKKKPGRKL